MTRQHASVITVATLAFGVLTASAAPALGQVEEEQGPDMATQMSEHMGPMPEHMAVVSDHMGGADMGSMMDMMSGSMMDMMSGSMMGMMSGSMMGPDGQGMPMGPDGQGMPSDPTDHDAHHVAPSPAATE